MIYFRSFLCEALTIKVSKSKYAKIVGSNKFSIRIAGPKKSTTSLLRASYYMGRTGTKFRST
jgi:hypothetical protein